MVEISEDKVIAIWLTGELQSARFSLRLKELMQEYKNDAALLLEPDLSSEGENTARKKLLYAYRPYLENHSLFEQATWFEDKWSVSEALSRLEYMDYSYWNEISQKTSRPREAAKTINKNVEIYRVSNEPFRQAAKAWLAGTDFPPLIALHGENKWILLEGHLRLTALALAENEERKIKKRNVALIYGESMPKNEL